jgi:hypothetical protein
VTAANGNSGEARSVATTDTRLPKSRGHEYDEDDRRDHAACEMDQDDRVQQDNRGDDRLPHQGTADHRRHEWIAAITRL